MIGELPTSINVDDRNFDIRTDYRIVLRIFCAFNDPELTAREKWQVMLELLVIDYEHIQDVGSAINECVKFLNAGRTETEKTSGEKRLYDWEQDEQMIFSGINKVAGHDVRSDDYMHWWTFLGLFMEIGEGTFSYVVGIRDKKNRNKKLEKSEQEFYRKNKSLIDLHKKYSEVEKENMQRINAMYQ